MFPETFSTAQVASSREKKKKKKKRRRKRKERNWTIVFAKTEFHEGTKLNPVHLDPISPTYFDNRQRVELIIFFPTGRKKKGKKKRRAIAAAESGRRGLHANLFPSLLPSCSFQPTSNRFSFLFRGLTRKALCRKLAHGEPCGRAARLSAPTPVLVWGRHSFDIST